MSNNHYLPSQMPTVNVVNGFKLSNNDPVSLKVHSYQVIGQGTFGSIEKANVIVMKNAKDHDGSDSEKFIGAIKKVHQDPRYKNRELNIIQKIRCHPNIVEFKYYYYSVVGDDNKNSTDRAINNTTNNNSSTANSNNSVYLHLVMECLPECLSDLVLRHHRHGNVLPPRHIRLYTFQMLRALAHLHSLGVCHRDIKTSNLLVDENRLLLKLCDFGSAKQLVSGSPSVSYISSRYYRAPELLFGAQQYSTAIDVWSAGCVLGEMLRMGCLFTGGDTVDQIVKVIRVLGTPSSSDLLAMNPAAANNNSSANGPSPHGLPHVLPCPIRLFFPHHSPADLLDLLSQMLVYNPSKRPHPSRLLLHSAFHDIPQNLLNFYPDELSVLTPQERHSLLSRSEPQ